MRQHWPPAWRFEAEIGEASASNRQSVTVRVPRGAAPAVVERYAALPTGERVNFIEHVVRRGETLGGISVRYGISLRFVRAANPNVRVRSMRIGQRLVIPVSQAARRGAARPSTATRRAAVPSSGYHTIRRGESLWLVSQRYGLQVEDLRAWNDIAAGDTLVRTGQRLRIVP